jgi:hypothetical protein
MSCPTIFEALRIATESLGDQIHTVPSPTTFFYNFVERGAFKKNAGITQTTFKAGRIEPDSSTSGWTDLSLSSNVITGAACDRTYSDVDVGFDELTYAPRALGLAGPVICRDRLTFAHNPMQFIKLYVRQLSNYVKRKFDLELRNQAIKLGTKVVMRPGGLDSAFTGTTLPTIAPNSVLTVDWLADVAAYLIREGAANADAETIELGPDGPVFPLVIGLEAIKTLTKLPSASRTDFNYADMGKGQDANTFKAIGATRVIGNFRLVPEAFPPRYDLVGGILVERQAFETLADSATQGVKSTLTSAYKNAAFEGAIIPHKQQFKANIVSPETAGLEFEPSSYTGDWKFVTGGERIASNNNCFDPMHKFGRHYSEIMYAAEPIYTNYGMTLIFKRDAYGNQNTVAPGYVG